MRSFALGPRRGCYEQDRTGWPWGWPGAAWAEVLAELRAADEAVRR